MLPNHLDAKTRQRRQRQHIHTYTNITNGQSCKISANQIRQYSKRITQHDQLGYIPGLQGYFNIYKLM